jgi:2-methylisocitrate lyase-like PEP mutase family enzyme
VKPTTKMRQLLGNGTTTIMPAVGDPFSARLVLAEGYETIMVSGNATSAMRLGLPDVGLLSLPENADNVRRIYDATGLAVFADADTGYGNEISVRRTIREFERAGAAAIMFEDQVFPKKCGMLAGKEVITTGQMVDKIKAAVDARDDGDLVIVGRTDARDVEGFQAAVDRANAYAEAGVDAIYVAGPRTEVEAQALIHALDIPQLYNTTPNGKGPQYSVDDLTELGFSLFTFSVYLLLVAMAPMRDMLQILKRTGDLSAATGGAASLDEYLKLLDLDGWSGPLVTPTSGRRT